MKLYICQSYVLKTESMDQIRLTECPEMINLCAKMFDKIMDSGVPLPFLIKSGASRLLK